MFDWLRRKKKTSPAPLRAPEAKESAVFRVVVMALPQSGGGVSRKRDYESFAREGYAHNPTVYACVNEIATASARIPFILYRRRRGGELDEVMNHPLMDLLRRPNPLMGGVQFMQAVAGHMMIAGNAYIEAVTPRAKKEPSELYCLRPDRMKVLPDPVHLVGGYEYKAGGKTVRFGTMQVMHAKLFHPRDDFYGLSPMEAAALAVDRGNEADAWNAALFRNRAVPAGMLTSDQPMTDEQFDQALKQLTEQFTGPNRHKPLLAPPGMKWEDIGLNATELDFIEGKKLTALEIAQVYNVPPELIGLQSATFQNRKEARKALYTEVVLPLMELILGDLNNWLTPRYGSDLFLAMNTDAVEALSDDRDSLWKRANESEFLTLNEQREMVGFKAIDGGNEVFIPLNAIPLSDAALGVPEEGAEDGLGEGEQSGCPAHDHETKEAQPEGKAFSAAERKRFRREFREVARIRDRFTRRLIGRLRRQFETDSKAVAGAFERGGMDAAITELARRSKESLTPMLERHYQDVLRAFGARALDQAKSAAPEIETKQDEAEDLFAAIASRFAREQAGKRVKDIEGTTRDEIERAIEEGIENEEPTEDIARRIKERINGMKKKRAQVIARTETHNAQNAGQLEQIRALGRDDMLKGWLWSGVSRSEHAAIDGAWVPLNERFLVGGAEMDRPGDPAGGPANTVNCSCTLVFRRAD